jgi:hypothetical protein
VEVLAPSGISADDIKVLAPNDTGSLSVKRVDLHPREGDSVRWRAMSQAATGQVIVLCHGDVRLRRPETLSQICAWSMVPRIGAVTIEIQGPKRGPLAGLSLVKGSGGLMAVSGQEDAMQAASRPVTAAPAAFMAISRESLVAVSGFDSERLPRTLADVDLALRLRKAGRVSILISGPDAIADERLVAEWSMQSISPSDASVLGEDIAEYLRPWSWDAPTGP